MIKYLKFRKDEVIHCHTDKSFTFVVNYNGQNIFSPRLCYNRLGKLQTGIYKNPVIPKKSWLEKEAKECVKSFKKDNPGKKCFSYVYIKDKYVSFVCFDKSIAKLDLQSIDKATKKWNVIGEIK